MSSRIDLVALSKWNRIAPDAINSHSEAKMALTIKEDPRVVAVHVGNMMADEVIEANKSKKQISWILPAGPMMQYKTFIDRVNNEKITLENLTIFHMDDFLDWEGRSLPLDHFYSLEARMNSLFYGAISKELNIPVARRFYPHPDNLDEIDAIIENSGGVDTCYGGIGIRGHVAFNDPPRNPWCSISNEQFRNSKSRILQLNEETVELISLGYAGGASYVVPPMAVTIGMKSILKSHRIRLIEYGGGSKSTIMRVAVFHEPTIEFPVTFCQECDTEIITDYSSIVVPKYFTGEYVTTLS
jgi:glucosamine-6-phosphate deaminase